MSTLPVLVVQLNARPTGDQEIAGSIPAGSGNILSCRLITKYFLRSFSSFCWFRAAVSFWRKNVHKYGLTAIGLSVSRKTCVKVNWHDLNSVDKAVNSKLTNPMSTVNPHYNDIICSPSRKYAYIILTPLKPHFYTIQLGFTGVWIIFLISAQKHRLWYSLEPPRRGGSNEYLQSLFWAETGKLSDFFIRKFSIFLVVKFWIGMF